VTIGNKTVTVDNIPNNNNMTAKSTTPQIVMVDNTCTTNHDRKPLQASDSNVQQYNKPHKHDGQPWPKLNSTDQ